MRRKIHAWGKLRRAMSAWWLEVFFVLVVNNKLM